MPMCGDREDSLVSYPRALRDLISGARTTLVLSRGCVQSSFEQVERETGVPVYRGPRHAADLAWILPLVGKVPLSRTVPAEDFLAAGKAEDAMARVISAEKIAGTGICDPGTKIGGKSRMKVLAEIMDAHCVEDIAGNRGTVFFPRGRHRRSRVWLRCDSGGCETGVLWTGGIDGPLAVDTQDPALIRAALFRADLVLSLQETNIPKVGKDVARAGAAAVMVPGARTLAGKHRKGTAGRHRAASSPIRSSSRSARDWSPRSGSSKTMAARSSLVRETWSNFSMLTRRGKRPPCRHGDGSRGIRDLLKRALGQDPGLQFGRCGRRRR